MQFIDWSILSAFCAIILTAAIYIRKYTKSVADFLVANRCAGRYLLTIAEGAAGIGAISVVAQFELYQIGGFTPAMWEMLNIPLWLLLSLSGWIIYRFRQTRVLTMAQFLELRYGKSFRVFVGLTAFIAGIINYGIFPAVTARFFINVFAWPEIYSVLGVDVSTYASTMIVLLSLALFITLNGGQIVIIVSDFIQGQFINIVFVIATIVVLVKFGWIEIGEAMTQGSDGASRVNPFDTAKAETFSLWFFLIILFQRFYGYMAWQGSQGYNSSAINPHEARMARILSQWRAGIMLLAPMVMAVCAYTAMNHPEFTEMAGFINADLAKIENPQIQQQMLTPTAIRYMLPAGVLGLFITMMLAAGISTDSTYLHSWGSIFLQDVVMPFRKKAFAPRQHLRLLRLSIAGVAVFAFFFSLNFVQTKYILPFFILTGSLFTAGAGTCIIGGLYWKRGTNAGAWGAMTVGIVLVLTQFTIDRMNDTLFYEIQYVQFIVCIVTAITIGVVYTETQSLKEAILSATILSVICTTVGYLSYLTWGGGRLQYMPMVFITQIAAICVYITVSLITGRGRECNMDRLLHRGKYAVIDDSTEATQHTGLSWWQKRLGINEDFNQTDRLVYYATIGLLFTMLAVFLGSLTWHLFWDPTHEQWMKFWYIFLFTNLGIFMFATVWMLIGGVVDLRKMFARLNVVVRTAEDDGFVIDGYNANEEHKSTTDGKP